jgi:hypothetical protein
VTDHGRTAAITRLFPYSIKVLVGVSAGVPELRHIIYDQRVEVEVYDSIEAFQGE